MPIFGINDRKDQLSNGCHSIPAIINNNNGTVTIGTFEASLCPKSSGDFPYSRHIIASATLSIVDLSTNYIIVNYNSGSPILSVTQDVTIINETTIIPVFTIFRNGNYLHTQNWDSLGNALANKVHQSIVKTQRYRRENGLMMSEFGTRNLSLTEGRIWTGAVPITLTAINTTTDSIYEWYKTGGTWTQRLVTAYNNTEWQNGDNLATLTANRYAVRWIFRGVESEKHLYCVYGTGDYTENQALNATVPTLPIAISSHAVLVAKLIVQKSASTAYSIQSAFDTQFSLAPINNHQDLTNLPWVDSRHTGTANTIAGFDALGASKEYALTELASKKLVVQNTIGHITILNGIAIKKGTPTKIATCDSSYTYIWQLNADASCERLAKIATANAQLILYVESVDEFHVFGNLSANLYRIDGTTNALNGTTTINAQTTVNRYGCCQSTAYEYYSSDAGTVLNQRNIASGAVATKTVGNQIHSIRCFTQDSVNYIAIQYYRTLDIYNESLTLVSSANIGLQYYFKSMDYRDNKLYVSSCSPTSDNDQYLVVVDTSNISSLTFEKKYFQTGRILKMADYLLTESHANLTYDQNCFLTLRNNDLTAVDTLTLQPNSNGWMNWIHDDVNDVIIGLTSYNLLPFMSKIFILKIK